jgi:hypothetical protein
MAPKKRRFDDAFFSPPRTTVSPGRLEPLTVQISKSLANLQGLKLPEGRLSVVRQLLRRKVFIL